MSNLFWLTEWQMKLIRPFLPKPRGRPRVDDLRVLSGIIFVIRNGLRWCDAPPEYGPHKTLYNRWKRWSERGVFRRIFEALADADGDANDTLMIDATHLKTHRTASSLKLGKREGGRDIGRTKGGLNTKLHAVTDAIGRPVRMILTAGQISDYTGARRLVGALPADARKLVADRGYDADWFRNALRERRIDPCIPPRRNRVEPVDWDPGLYVQRHRIENFFARLKDWRRVAMRYDRCPEVFLSACLLAAIVMFWL